MVSHPGQSQAPENRPWFFREGTLFWGLVLIHAGYVWLFNWFPTQDGPSHVDNAVALFRMFSHQDSILDQYYLINTGSYPNWLGALLLGALTRVLPLFQAEKALLCGYLILVPVTFRYALKGLGRDAAGLVFFIFPLLYNRLFFMGFHSWCYSLAFFFLVVGYWLRRRDRMSPGSMAVMALLALTTLLWHLISLVLAGLVVGCVILGEALVQGRREYENGRFRPVRAVGALFKKMLVPAVVFLPSMVLVAIFMGKTQGGVTNVIGPARLAGHLAAGTVIINFGWWELAMSVPYVISLVLVGWLVLRAGRKRPWSGAAVGLVLNFVLVAALYLVIPDGMGGGGTISLRLALFVTLTAIVAAAGQGALPDRARRIAIWGPVALSVLFLVFRYQPLDRINDYLDDYLSGLDRIESGRTIFPVSFLGRGHPLDRDLAWRVHFFSHAGGYISAARHGVSLRNYEGRMSYFPLIVQAR